jgi:hypothetical protein
MRKRSLGFKLIVGGIVTVLVPILMTGLYSLIKASEALDASAREKTAMAAYSLADMADMVFQEEAKFLSEMASRSAVKSAALRVKGAGPAEAAQEISALNLELTTSLKILLDIDRVLVRGGLPRPAAAGGIASAIGAAWLRRVRNGRRPPSTRGRNHPGRSRTLPSKNRLSKSQLFPRLVFL